MNAHVTISIQINEEDHQGTSTLHGNEQEGGVRKHWQFSAESLSAGNLINLLLDLESLGFETDS